MNKKIMIGIAVFVVIILILFIIFFGRSNTDIILDPDSLDELDKQNIVSGEEKKVSPEIREQVKKDYLKTCDEISDSQKKIECLEVYYDGENVLSIKEECASKEEQEKDDCMDRYYSAQAHGSSNKVFCESIKDEDEREDCFTYI